MRNGFIILLIIMFAACSLSAYVSDEEIAQIRAKIKANGWQFTVGHTTMTRLPDEIVRGMLMHLPSQVVVNPHQTSFRLQAPKNVLAMPEHFDWRNNGGNYVTPIRDQANCGSCWAFGTTAVFESAYLIAHHTPGVNFDLAEQYLVSTCYSGGSCGGGWPASVYPFFISSGIPDEACYPYRAQNSNCNERCSDWASRLQVIKSYTNVTASTDAVKAALRTGLVSTVMDVDNAFYSYTGGVYEGNTGHSSDHVVALLGWDDAESYWIAKNSWGTGWGEQGFFRTRWGNAAIPWSGQTQTCIVEGGGGGETITVVKPNGGETYTKGMLLGVFWTTSAYAQHKITNSQVDAISEVKIFLSTDGKSTWTTLSARTANDGAETFPVPNVNSTNCYIRVQDYADTQGTGYDDSDAAFTINNTGFKSNLNAQYIPKQFSLSISPNPIRTTASISISIPENAFVRIRVYDLTGKQVAVVRDEAMKAGSYTLGFNPAGLGNGVYIMKVTAGKHNTIKHIAIIR